MAGNFIQITGNFAGLEQSRFVAASRNHCNPKIQTHTHAHHVQWKADSNQLLNIELPSATMI